MNLDELRAVQSEERRTDSLQDLRPSFYRDVAEYIETRKEERDRAADRAEDPFSSPEVGRLTDEIETAKDVVVAIYERRMGKLLKQASLAAAGMPADDDGLTAEEAELFDDLVDRIHSNKTDVLDALDGDHHAVDGDATDETAGPTDPTPPPPPDEPPSDGEGRVEAAAADADGVTAADAMGVGSTDGPSSANEGTDDYADDPAPDVDRVTVRITRDVGAILGVDDREYTLSNDDVVTLPEQNATPLIERDAAEPLE